MSMLEGMNLENLLNEHVLMFVLFDDNGVWFGEVLYPPRVRNIGRGKPNIRLTPGWREEVIPKTTSSSVLISKSTATGVALMIYESAATQFSSTIFASAVNCVALMIFESVATRFSSMISDSVVAHVGWRFLPIMLSPTNHFLLLNSVSPVNQFSLSNYGVCSDPVFATKFCVARELVFRCRIMVLATNSIRNGWPGWIDD